MAEISKRQEMIAAMASALSNPLRVAILERLIRESCCYHGDLSEELPIAKSTLSQHLKALKNAGLIQGEIEAPKTKYCINQKNWGLAKGLFMAFFDRPLTGESCESSAGFVIE